MFFNKRFYKIGMPDLPETPEPNGDSPQTPYPVIVTNPQTGQPQVVWLPTPVTVISSLPAPVYTTTNTNTNNEPMINPNCNCYAGRAFFDGQGNCRCENTTIDTPPIVVIDADPKTGQPIQTVIPTTTNTTQAATSNFDIVQYAKDNPLLIGAGLVIGFLLLSKGSKK